MEVYLSYLLVFMAIKEVLDIQTKTKDAFTVQATWNEDIKSLCSTIIELRRLLQVEKTARVTDAKLALEYFTSRPIFPKEIVAREHFKKIAKGE